MNNELTTILNSVECAEAKTVEIPRGMATDIVQMVGPMIQESATAWAIVQALLPAVHRSGLSQHVQNEIDGTDMIHTIAPEVRPATIVAKY